jgi:hypothetical protein
MVYVYTTHQLSTVFSTFVKTTLLYHLLPVYQLKRKIITTKHAIQALFTVGYNWYESLRFTFELTIVNTAVYVMLGTIVCKYTNEEMVHVV